LIQNDEILLIQHIKNNKKYWLLPGGGVKFGEDLKSALKREMEEELGVKIEVGDLLFASDSISVKEARHIVNLYFQCEYVSGDYKLATEERLNSYGFFNYSKLEEMKIIPPIKTTLINFIKNNSQKNKKYLGSRWDKI
jgi:ADP-ribose pyrophosphatase YjhB (NUDIX family)